MPIARTAKKKGGGGVSRLNIQTSIVVYQSQFEPPIPTGVGAVKIIWY